MANLSPLQDLSTGPITRQTLFDMWDTAVLTSLSESDLASGLKPLLAQDTAPSDPAPGQLWVDTNRKLIYVWTDEHENTGVSLWLAVGPDRLETPCLTAGPIAAGGIVEAWYDRWVKVATTGEGALGDGVLRVIGANQSGVPYPLHVGTPATADSGTWIAVAIEGMASAFIPAVPVADSLAGPDTGLPVGVDPTVPGAIRSCGTWSQRRINPAVGEGLYSWPPTTTSDPNLVNIKLTPGPRRMVL